MPFDALFPSDAWQTSGIHWHAHTERRATRAPMRVGHRADRLTRRPDMVLWEPWAVAMWIDARTRHHVTHTKVWVTHEQAWVAIGDENDLDELRHQNYLVASRGDSIYADIHAPKARTHHDLFVEAVTRYLCQHNCVRSGQHDNYTDK